MFRLIKWAMIILFLLVIYYTVVFFMDMTESDAKKIKQDAIVALESNDPAIFVGTLSEKIKNDISQRKSRLQKRLKDQILWLINSE